VTPAAPNSGATYYSIPISLQVLGTWADTVDFLQRVIKLDRGVRIIESSSGRTSNTDQVSRENETIPDYSELTDVRLEVYMIPASPPATSTVAPTPAQ
jgi:hypothetical protein